MRNNKKKNNLTHIEAIDLRQTNIECGWLNKSDVSNLSKKIYET